MVRRTIQFMREIPGDDRERMAKIYGSAFGWQTQMLGEEMGNS